MRWDYLADGRTAALCSPLESVGCCATRCSARIPEGCPSCCDSTTDDGDPAVLWDCCCALAAGSLVLVRIEQSSVASHKVIDLAMEKTINFNTIHRHSK